MTTSREAMVNRLREFCKNKVIVLLRHITTPKAMAFRLIAAISNRRQFQPKSPLVGDRRVLHHGP